MEADTYQRNAVSYKSAHFGYDLSGLQTEIRTYAGSRTLSTTVATTTKDYDKSGRIDLIEHYRGSDTQAAHADITGYDLDYDLANRVSSIQFTQLVYQGESLNSITYDDSGQITVADFGIQADETYAYDDNGNRTRKNSGADNYDIDPNNQLVQDHDNSTYLYDEQGNRTERHTSGGAWTKYTWDHRNRLVNVKD
jgi:YD repeat-containing protein